MNCFAHIPNINFVDIKTMNEEVLSQIMMLPDSLRKEIRLLARQYILLEFIKQDLEYCNDIVVREMPYLLKYKAFDNDAVFEWEIDPKRLYD